ncbi:MAG: hypothetical protein JWN30_1461 [Bacilli bacterium]|nr:hypothetical protein [Bacilli bacterium]
MKFVEQMYLLYKDQLTGDDEDALVIVSSILSDLNKEHMLEIIQEMSNQEVYQMLGTYLVERLNQKLGQEGAGGPEYPVDSDHLH